jgi:hypothetical protein
MSDLGALSSVSTWFPKEPLKIARQFTAGLGLGLIPVPKGTAEKDPQLPERFFIAHLPTRDKNEGEEKGGRR